MVLHIFWVRGLFTLTRLSSASSTCQLSSHCGATLMQWLYFSTVIVLTRSPSVTVPKLFGQAVKRPFLGLASSLCPHVNTGPSVRVSLTRQSDPRLLDSFAGTCPVCLNAGVILAYSRPNQSEPATPGASGRRCVSPLQ
jgi:hypothetical protein